MYELLDDQIRIQNYMIMEYSSGSISLHKYLLQNKKISEDKTKRIIKQILQGLAYLKTRRIIHRDLHPGNIIIDENGLNLKIIDFGVSLKLKKNE